MMNLMKNFFSLMLILTFFLACSKTSPSFSVEARQLEEIREGEEKAKKILKHAKLSEDTKAIEIINRVGKKLTDVVDKEYHTSYSWEFHLIDDPWRANAFCLEGGKIFVFSGLFPYLDNEDELAVVLGHEIVHAIANHRKKQDRGEVLSKVMQTASSLLVFVNPFSLPFVKEKEMKQSDELVKEFGIIPYIQSHEYEADKIGLEIMKKAGYNPQAGISFWSKFPKTSRMSPEYSSTHPSAEHRLERILDLYPLSQKNLKENHEKYSGLLPDPKVLKFQKYREFEMLDMHSDKKIDAQEFATCMGNRCRIF